jgi:aryl-alcohol dehydrogenase-like predicted oxidoreductase
MNYRHLGRLGLKVSPICLGTMNFGPQTSETDSHAIMDRALELGINFFDTANVYGQRTGVGTTETIVGNWFARGGGRRDKVVLATKVYSEMGSWPNESRLSALHIRQACEDSLRRLQTDHLDIYQMHHVYREATWDEIWQAFETLVQQGKVVYVGSSNFAGWHIAKANEAARDRHFLGLVSEQCIYNLAERTVELEVLPACEDYGMGVIPWSPLWRGLLAAFSTAEGRRGRDERRAWCRTSSRSTVPRSRPTRSSAPRSASHPRRSRSRGCSPTPWSPRRSSARGSPSSSRARCGR